MFTFIATDKTRLLNHIAKNTICRKIVVNLDKTIIQCLTYACYTH